MWRVRCLWFWTFVSLMIDMEVVLSINGHLHYPNDTDRSLNEPSTDKIRKYRADYNNNPQRLSPLWLLLLVRLGGYTVNLWAFYFYKIIGKLLYIFRSSSSVIHQWPVPLQTRGVLLVAQSQGRQHFRQGCNTEDHPERRWRTCVVQITHSPITLAKPLVY